MAHRDSVWVIRSRAEQRQTLLVCCRFGGPPGQDVATTGSARQTHILCRRRCALSKVSLRFQGDLGPIVIHIARNPFFGLMLIKEPGHVNSASCPFVYRLPR